MKDLIMFGMQGSGKGTQGAIIAEEYGYKIFETGAELRALTQEDPDLGRKVKAIVDKGDLVPNEIVMEIIENFLDKVDAETPVLFDGLPRSMPQKETFDALLEKKERNPHGIFIDLSEEEAVKRMLLRGRADDNEEAIKNRIGNYRKETIPVIEEYEKDELLTRVNGIQSIEEVYEDIVKVIEEKVK